jgi:hypothetical protein
VTPNLDLTRLYVAANEDVRLQGPNALRDDHGNLSWRRA